MPQSTLPTEGGGRTVGNTDRPTDSRDVGNSRGLAPALIILAAGVVVAFLYFARDVIIPIVLGTLLSFLLAPAVRWLRRTTMGRVPAIMLTMLVAFLAIFGFAAVVVHETTTLAEQLPEYRYNLQAKVRSLPGVMPGNGVFHSLEGLFTELRSELTRSQTQNLSPGNRQSQPGAAPGDWRGSLHE